MSISRGIITSPNSFTSGRFLGSEADFFPVAWLAAAVPVADIKPDSNPEHAVINSTNVMAPSRTMRW